MVLTYGWDMFKRAGLFEKYKEPLLVEAYNIINIGYERVKNDEEASQKWLIDTTAAVSEYFGDLLG